MPHYKLPSDQMHGYSVQFSPFVPNRLAVAAAQPFGSLGPGALFILTCSDDSEHLYQEHCYKWSDGLLASVWSKNNPHQVLTGSGDGTLQLWDTSNGSGHPLEVFKEHNAEVYAVDWATINQNPQMLSGGWDGRVKLWDPTRKMSLITFDHAIDGKQVSRDTLMIFDVSFSGGHNSLFSSVGTDNVLRIWNLNEATPVTLIKTKANELLTCDWVEKSENVIGVGGSNGNVYIYDLRHVKKELSVLKTGTETAIRKIKFSPFESSVLASVGYDSVTRIWDYKRPQEPLSAVCHHGDCVCGVDWDPLNVGRLADCGWDSIINVFNVKTG